MTPDKILEGMEEIKIKKSDNHGNSDSYEKYIYKFNKNKSRNITAKPELF